MVWRIFVELMIWLPLVLIFTTKMEVRDRVITVGIILLFIALGLLVNRFPPLWRRLAMISIIIALIGLGIGQYTNLLPVFLWLGIVLWRGRFVTLGHWHYGLAFCVCCAGLIVGSKVGAWADYRIAFIVLAVVWVVQFFYVLNRGLVENAGLHNGILTSPVKKASRNYLLIFLAIGVVVIALTASYGERWLTPKQVKWERPTGQIEQPIPPPESMDMPDWMNELAKKQGKPSVLWDYVFWALIAAGAYGVFWFVRLGWKERRTWREIIRLIRAWFLREKKAEELPYVEEHRSLRKEKKEGQSFFDSLFRRHGRKVNWDQLSNPEKVRRLYEEAIMTGIEQGYTFRPSDTPSETLEGLETWREALPTSSKKEKNVDYWSRFLQIRRVLLKLYEKAKYSPHEVTSQEAESLKEQISDR